MPSLRFTLLNGTTSLSVTVMSSQYGDVRSDALLKNLPSEMKGVQEKESIMGVRGRQKKNVPCGHYLTSLCKPLDARQ